MASPKELRQFGLLVGGVFAAIGAFVAWRSGLGAGSGALLGVGATLVTGGLVAPRLLGPVERVWMTVGGFLGEIMTAVLLTVFYFTLLIPFALVRFTDPLRLKRRDCDTYWLPYKNSEPTLERFKRPF